MLFQKYNQRQIIKTNNEREDWIDLPTKIKHGNHQKIVSSKSKVKKIHKTKIESKE